MRLHRGNRRDYAREMLWRSREDFWPHLLVHDCLVRRLVEETCRIADWNWDLYRTAVAFDSAWLLDGATRWDA